MVLDRARNHGAAAGADRIDGLSGGIGHFLLIRAYHHAPASTLTPFIYTQLIWATLLGWLVFGQFPDAWSLSGIAIIAASGLWMALGERRRVRPS